jgi:hypothetical protein
MSEKVKPRISELNLASAISLGKCAFHDLEKMWRSVSSNNVKIE